MPNIRLTRRAVDAIPYSENGQTLYRDTLLSGFGCGSGANPRSTLPKGRWAAVPAG